MFRTHPNMLVKYWIILNYKLHKDKKKPEEHDITIHTVT